MDDQSVEMLGILEILRENPRGMSVTDIAACSSVNRNTVSRYLDMLKISGQVEMRTYGKAKVFYLSRRVPISAMLDLSSDLVIVLDRDMTIVQANEAVCRFARAESDAVIGRHLRDSPLAAFDHPLIISRIKESLEGSEIVEELRFIRAGEEIFFRFKIIPSVFNSGTPGVTLILEDITTQKHSEEALRQSEHKYRTIVEEINDLIWHIDEEGGFTYLSPPCNGILGWHPEELEGRTITSLMDAVEAAKLQKALAGENGTHKSFSFLEMNLHHRDGRQVVLESSGSPIFDEFGEYSGYRFISRDITERKDANRRVWRWKTFLYSIVENIPHMVLVREMEQGKFIFFNRSAEEALGRSKEEMLYKDAWELFSPDVAGTLIDGDEEAAAGAVPVEVMDASLALRNGAARIFHLTKLPLFSQGGELKYILTLGEDITERRHAEEALIAERDLARSYLEVAGVLIAVVLPDGTIERISQHGAGLLGYRPSELIGRNWFEILVPPGIRDRLRSNYSAIIASAGAPANGEAITLIGKGNRPIRLLCHNTKLLDAQGRIQAVVCSGSPL